uniref:Uncharacterized protein n=1 Tax=Corethron hystrix TaxID=216773 RepID=A0A7S1BET1_9STRA|mmetsp:Transcript_24872/g.57338  ORF Transcript_24872/g.57338 Transcript_24872/m.57338 type:complete len:570 (+) Transcript_24872:199-1908(+)
MKQDTSALKFVIPVVAMVFFVAFMPNFLFPEGIWLYHLAARTSKEKKLASTVSTGENEKSPPTPDTSVALPQVFDGVDLPENKVPPPVDNPITNDLVNQFVPQAITAAAPLLDKPKSEGTGSLQELILDTTLRGTVPDDDDYQYFGNGNNTKILRYLLVTDPFFASALTKTKLGFELRSFENRDHKGNLDPSLYRKMVTMLMSPGRRVNFFFDRHMEIRGYKAYDDMMGQKVSDSFKGDMDIDYWASSVLYNLGFYASCIHATIHVFHYLLTSAFQYVSEDFEPMHQWAVHYANNISQKYGDVSNVLIRDPPSSSFSSDPNTIVKNYFGLNAILTGIAGFNAKAGAIQTIMADLLNSWGQSATASGWFDVMMDISLEDMERAGILTQFRKQTDLITPFAQEVADAFRTIDTDATKAVEACLIDYLQHCGSFQSKIQSIEHWIELMSITADVHGATLGYSRLFAMGDIMRWRNIRDPTWDTIDLDFMVKLVGTIMGMEHDRHVMTSTMDGPYAPELQIVLEKFDAEVTQLKKNYEKDVQKDPDFKDHGWILSTYCTDGFDGKQMTAATYI